MSAQTPFLRISALMGITGTKLKCFWGFSREALGDRKEHRDESVDSSCFRTAFSLLSGFLLEFWTMFVIIVPEQ